MSLLSSIPNAVSIGEDLRRSIINNLKDEDLRQKLIYVAYFLRHIPRRFRAIKECDSVNSATKCLSKRTRNMLFLRKCNVDGKSSEEKELVLVERVVGDLVSSSEEKKYPVIGEPEYMAYIKTYYYEDGRGIGVRIVRDLNYCSIESENEIEHVSCDLSISPPVSLNKRPDKDFDKEFYEPLYPIIDYAIVKDTIPGYYEINDSDLLDPPCVIPPTLSKKRSLASETNKPPHGFVVPNLYDEKTLGYYSKASYGKKLKK